MANCLYCVRVRLVWFRSVSEVFGGRLGPHRFEAGLRNAVGRPDPPPPQTHGGGSGRIASKFGRRLRRAGMGPLGAPWRRRVSARQAGPERARRDDRREARAQYREGRRPLRPGGRHRVLRRPGHPGMAGAGRPRNRRLRPGAQGRRCGGADRAAQDVKGLPELRSAPNRSSGKCQHIRMG